jgi:hypothetical protein
VRIDGMSILPCMSRRIRFNGKVYKPTPPGGELVPGTVDWELARRRASAEKRADTIAWKKMQARPRPAPDIRLDRDVVAHPLTTPWRILFAWIGRKFEAFRNRGN